MTKKKGVLALRAEKERFGVSDSESDVDEKEKEKIINILKKKGINIEEDDNDDNENESDVEEPITPVKKVSSEDKTMRKSISLPETDG